MPRRAHKPHIETHDNSEFVAVNVQGTLNLLEEAVAPGSKVDRFVFTSTTSLMISQKIRDGKAGGAHGGDLDRRGDGAARAAQHLRRHQARGRGTVPAVQPPATSCRSSSCARRASSPRKTTWRTPSSSRARTPRPTSSCSAALSVEDAAEAHVVALAKAPEIGFDTFIVSALTPFSARGLPRAHRRRAVGGRALLPRLSRALRHSAAGRCSTTIDRVYDASKAARVLGFTCRTDFREILAALGRRQLSRLAGVCSA